MGGKSQDVITGYKYFLGAQLALSHGPVDEVKQFIYGERLAWEGSITGNGDAYVNKPELFGGESREGGVVGTFTVSQGDTTTQDPYLLSLLGPHVPAGVGVLNVIFKYFMWSTGNPYFKAPWFKVKRVLKGWKNNAPWYSAKASIGTLDMNPVHIIYQALTDDKWGMGYNAVDVDDTSFMAAADQLYTENFGLSLIWDQQMTLEEFIQVILNHINGQLDLNLRSGKFTLKLIRDGYDINTLLELSPSNVIELTSFQRAAWAELANELTVKYTDRDQNEQTVTVQDLAVIEAEGRVINTTKTYSGIRDVDLAMRVAMRDLATSSAPLAKITVTTTRVTYDKTIGDVIAFTWPALGITKAPFRIVSINKGNLLDSGIQIEAVEDIFGLPSNAYTSSQPSLWTDPVVDPQPAVAPLVLEAPYWDISRKLSTADLDALTPGYAFGEAIAAVPTYLNYGFDLYNSPIATGHVFSSKGHFAPSGTIASELDYTTNSVTLAGVSGINDITAGGYAIINGEYVALLTIDTLSGAITIARGVLDTVPKKHPIGTRIYFCDSGYNGYDPTEHSLGTTEHYKILPRTGLGTLALASATDLPLTFTGRAHMPYPPGNLKLNGISYPSRINGPLTITWAHRDRLSQTDTLIPYNASSIGPESGTTYFAKLTGESAVIFNGDVGSGTTFDFDELSTSGVTDSGTNRDIRGLGLAIVTSATSTALNSAHIFAPVSKSSAFGWLGACFRNPPGFEAKHVLSSTGAVTTRAFPANWNDPVLPFSVKTTAYKSMTTPDTYIGWGVSTAGDDSAHPYSLLNSSDAGFYPITDRRADVSHVFYACFRGAYLYYFPQSRYGDRFIQNTDYGLRRLTKAGVLTGPVTLDRTTVETFNYGPAAQFDSFTERYPNNIGYSGFFGTYAKLPAGPEGPNALAFNRTIIFGSLMYYSYVGANTSVNTAGKTIDITNILTAHIDVANSLTDRTKVYSVDASGNLTLLSTRTGVYLADQIDATQGVEVFGTTVRLVNMTTGATGSSIATLPSPATSLCGDVPNGCVYILCANGYLYKYNAAGTMLGSIAGVLDPVGYPASTPNISISVSVNKIYIASYIEVAKDLSTLVLRDVYYGDKDGTMGIAVSDPSTSVHLASYLQATQTIKTLVDDSGVSDIVYNGATPRLNDTVTLELNSVRDGFNSYTKHNNQVIRAGYGLRYGQYYGG